MQVVSQFGSRTIGVNHNEDNNKKKSHELKHTSLTGTRTIATLPSFDAPEPKSASEEERQLQFALAASLGSDWTPSYPTNDEGTEGDETEASLLSSPGQRSKKGHGYFC